MPRIMILDRNGNIAPAKDRLEKDGKRIDVDAAVPTTGGTIVCTNGHRHRDRASQ